MTESGIKAVIDTSAIIQLREEWYAPDVFPGLNAAIESLAQQSGLITVDRVIDELAGQYSTTTDGMDAIRQPREWAKDVLPLLEDLAPDRAVMDIGPLAATIANQHQRWRNGEPADPMVIAAAEFFGCAVISGETRRVMGADDPKPISGTGQIRNPDGLYSSWIRIPDICLMRGIKHLDLLAFFRSQGWSF